MDPLDYDFCNLTDREEDPFSDYDLCNSTDGEQVPPISPRDNDTTDSMESDDNDVEDNIEEIEVGISLERPICRPNFALTLKKKRLRGYSSVEEVVKEHALSFLPAKSLLRLRTVCKNWDRWIGSPLLIHKNSNNFRSVSGLVYQTPYSEPILISLNSNLYGIPSLSSFLPEKVDIRASCGGLICCQGRFGTDNAYYVCSPASKEWRKLPKPGYYHGEKPAVVLAFDPSPFRFAANYNVVCAFQLSDSIICFEIYSSRTDTWRVSETMCSELGVVGVKSGGMYMNGYAYMETSTGVALAFSLDNESLEFVVLPACSGVKGIMADLNGELCYMLPRREELAEALVVDVYGGLSMSLQKTIEISEETVHGIGMWGFVELLSCINGETLVLLAGNRVVAYNEKTGVAAYMDDVWPWGGGSTYLPYVNSLVSVAPLVKLDDSEFCHGVCSGKVSAGQLSAVQDMF